MKITEAAILQDGIIYTGRRHCFCIRKMIEARIKLNYSNSVQGFITEDGKFFNRHESEKIARENGQLTKPMIGSVLTSEDLW